MSLNIGIKFTKTLFWNFAKKQTNAICTGGFVSTSHGVFFTHLGAIENLINIEFPGDSWQSTGSIITYVLQNCFVLFIFVFCFFDILYFGFLRLYIPYIVRDT